MPKEIKIEGLAVLHYTGKAVLVYDESETVPEVRWLSQHSKQGFSRRERSIQFSLLEEAGKAIISVFAGWPEDLNSAERAIAVPLRVTAGKVHVEGLEEWPTERYFEVAPGSYMAILLQRMDEKSNQLTLNLFMDLERVSAKSLILKADGSLDVPAELLETAEPLK